MEQTFYNSDRITEEEIQNLVREIANLNQRYDAYKAELDKLSQSIGEKTNLLSSCVNASFAVIQKDKAVFVAYDKTSKRATVQNPVNCVNL